MTRLNAGRRIVIGCVALGLLVAAATAAAVCSTRSVAEEVSAPDAMSLGEAYASLDSPNYDLYWLGEDVAFGDYKLIGPYVCPIGCELTVEVMEAHYRVHPDGSDLRWAISSIGAWERAQESFSSPRTGSVVADDLGIGGWQARRFTYFDDAGSVRALVIGVFAGERTVVVATTGEEPLRSYESLVDIIARNLRPYPE